MIKTSKVQPKSGMDGLYPGEKANNSGKTIMKKQTYFPRQKKAHPSILTKPSKGSGKKKVNASAPSVGKTAAPFHPRLRK